MQMYWTLFSLGMIVSLIGYIWLVVVGFKRSTLWGLLVLLFSPFSAVVFAITNWRDARIAFLIYLVSMFLVCGVSISFYSKFAPVLIQITERMQTGELTEDEGIRLLKDVVISGKMSLPAEKTETDKPVPTPEESDTNKPVEKTQEVENNKSAQMSKQENPKPDSDKNAKKASDKKAPLINIAEKDPLAQKPFVPPPDTTRVSLSRISHYVGRYFIITLKDGVERRGLLTQVTSTHLLLDRKLYGGNIRYEIRKTQVKSIKMLTRLPDER